MFVLLQDLVSPSFARAPRIWGGERVMIFRLHQHHCVFFFFFYWVGSGTQVLRVLVFEVCWADIYLEKTTQHLSQLNTTTVVVRNNGDIFLSISVEFSSFSLSFSLSPQLLLSQLHFFLIGKEIRICWPRQKEKKIMPNSYATMKILKKGGIFFGGGTKADFFSLIFFVTGKAQDFLSKKFFWLPTLKRLSSPIDWGSNKSIM